MFRKYLLPVLAVAGAIFAIWMVQRAAKPVIPAQPVADPPHPSISRKISGAGIVEASTRNLSIGSHTSGIVARVYVKVGDRVKPGDRLFCLDDRRLRAELAVREADQLQAEASLQDLRAQLEIAEAVKDPRAISIEDLTKRRYAVQVAEARVTSAKAAVRATQVAIDLLTVQAPVDGQILQVNIQPGEFVPSGVTVQPLILLGDVDKLHVRVDIDENDAWRFRPEARAEAFIRGNPEFKTGLTFEYIESYVVPKRSLTGDSTERVDTRVLQVVYSFSPKDLPVQPGQLLDVFIEDLVQPPSPTSAIPEPGKKK